MPFTIVTLLTPVGTIVGFSPKVTTIYLLSSGLNEHWGETPNKFKVFESNRV